MKLAVLGGTGGSGLALLKKAVAEGHDVAALLRNPDGVPKDLADSPNLRLVKVPLPLIQCRVSEGEGGKVGFRWTSSMRRAWWRG